MKKTLGLIAMAACASGVFAKTSLFGEADARALLVNTEAGAFMSLTGTASEFGFKGSQAVSDAETAYFRLAVGADLTGQFGLAINEGEVGLQGNYGEAALYFGYSPLSALVENHQILDNSPDGLGEIYGFAQANPLGLPVGISSLDGLRYRSPMVAQNVTLEAALIPSEQPDGETGFSFAGHYDTDAYRISAAFQINGFIANSSIFRVQGEANIGQMKAGGTGQISSNSDFDSDSSHISGYVKMPLKVADVQTQLRVLAAFNTVTNAADDSFQEFYTSAVQSIPLSSKVVAYGFASIFLANDLDTTTLAGGGGLKVRF